MTPSDASAVFVAARGLLLDARDRTGATRGPGVAVWSRRFDVAVIDARAAEVRSAALGSAAGVACQTVDFWRRRAVGRWGDVLDVAPRDLARRCDLCIGCVVSLARSGMSAGLWCGVCWAVWWRCGVLMDRLAGGRALRYAEPESEPEPEHAAGPEPRPVVCGDCGRDWRDCQGCGLRARVHAARSHDFGRVA